MNSKVKPRGKMTLEKLATLTHEEFLSVDEKFIAIDERFTSIDKKLASIDGRFIGLKDEIKTEIKKELSGATDKLLTKVDAISKKLDTLLQENKMGTGLYQRHDVKLENHEKRISQLESIPYKI